MKYLIVGDGPERHNLEGLVNKLGLQNQIEFVGAVSNDEAMQYMSICDVFSLPSWRETFGLVYIEAMLNEKPVIMCKDRAIEGTVINKKNGMVIEEKNVEQLVDAIKYLLANKKESNKIAISGKQTVEENFIWKEIGKKLENTYKSVLNKF